DRNRAFRGYRGFGVCRDLSHVERLATRRRVANESTPVLEPEAASGPAKDIGAPLIAPNVVRFPGAGPFTELRPLETEATVLGSGEHGAFHELARQLTVRLQAAELAPAISAEETAVAPAIVAARRVEQVPAESGSIEPGPAQLSPAAP